MSDLQNQSFYEYVEEKKEFYSWLWQYFDNQDDVENYFQRIIEIFDGKGLNNDKEELYHVLRIFKNIYDNHPSENLIKKMDGIFQYLKDSIIKLFSNKEIYKIFEDNKRILLYLLETKILTFSTEIYDLMKYTNDQYCLFFYPEIKTFFGEAKNIENSLLSKDENIMENFDEKRKEGENDSYICSLIRNDSIDEFIVYVNRTNCSLTSEIKSSIFETNSFLIDRKTSLIEYAAFFGSIQIFQYLSLNKVQLEPSLWFYAIHSNNEELIYILQSTNVKPPINDYKTCLIESIKCHHNKITDYFQENFLNQDHVYKNEEVYKNVLQYHNYQYFPDKIKGDYEFMYLCSNNYQKLVNLFINENGQSIKEQITIVLITFIVKKIYLNFYDQKIFLFSYFKFFMMFYFFVKILILFLFSFLNETSLKQAADQNNIEVMYYLLSQNRRIEKDCFRENENIRKIVIPPSIISIESHAFADCSSLEEIIIPYSVQIIGYEVFHNCTSLKHISLPSSIFSIDSYTFDGCDSLVEISIPLLVTRIEDRCFKYCYALTNVKLHSNIEAINSGAFAECISLTTIKIYNKVVDIGTDAFEGCSSLAEFIVPSSVEFLGKEAFHRCYSLKNITFEEPSKIMFIDKETFSECSSLTSIVIPSSVKKIYDEAFYKCKSLTKILIPASVTSIGEYAFAECTSLNEITFEDNSLITEIKMQTFYHCSSLVQITIPSSVKIIENSAFSNCSSLKKVILPSSLQTVGCSVFYECTSLEEITLPSFFTANDIDITDRIIDEMPISEDMKMMRIKESIHPKEMEPKSRCLIS